MNPRSVMLFLALAAVLAFGGFTVARDSPAQAVSAQQITQSPVATQSVQAVDPTFNVMLARADEKLFTVESNLHRLAALRAANNLAVDRLNYSEYMPAVYYADRYGDALPSATRRGFHVGKL